MLADLKDSVKNNRSLNIKDKYGSTAVSMGVVIAGRGYTLPISVTESKLQVYRKRMS